MYLYMHIYMCVWGWGVRSAVEDKCFERALAQFKESTTSSGGVRYDTSARHNYHNVCVCLSVRETTRHGRMRRDTFSLFPSHTRTYTHTLFLSCSDRTRREKRMFSFDGMGVDGWDRYKEDELMF